VFTDPKTDKSAYQRFTREKFSMKIKKNGTFSIMLLHLNGQKLPSKEFFFDIF